MKKLFKNFEATMMAAAFAEEGEFDTAREILGEAGQRKTDRPSLTKQKRADNRKELRAD
ncbi:MAG TPA: hypothetical protein VF790_05125 [Dissulfurispiraceae bacterium]